MNESRTRSFGAAHLAEKALSKLRDSGSQRSLPCFDLNRSATVPTDRQRSAEHLMDEHADSNVNGTFPRVTARRATRLSPWVELVETYVRAGPDKPKELYHSVRTADYTAVLGFTAEGQIPLVRQFRPSVGEWCIEFPAGLVDEGETPQESAARELEEETGYRAETLTALCNINADTGRLACRFHGFFARNLRTVEGWRPEADVELFLVAPGELLGLVQEDAFPCSPHVALIGIALINGLFPKD